jgi:hypothetical protein
LPSRFQIGRSRLRGGRTQSAKVNAEQRRERDFAPSVVALSELTLGPEWLMDTCRGRPGRNYLPGATFGVVLSARRAASLFVPSR